MYTTEGWRNGGMEVWKRQMAIYNLQFIINNNGWIATATSCLAMTKYFYTLFLAIKGFNILNKNETFAD